MMIMMVRSVIILISVVLASVHGYNVGVGRADVTGPAAEIGMMGYAKQGQNTKGRHQIIFAFYKNYQFSGIHTRQYSRAFIIEDDDKSRVVFVSIDCAMMGQLVKMFVLEELETLYPGVYNEKNLVLSSTHTHSGPAGKHDILSLYS